MDSKGTKRVEQYVFFAEFVRLKRPQNRIRENHTQSFQSLERSDVGRRRVAAVSGGAGRGRKRTRTMKRTRTRKRNKTATKEEDDRVDGKGTKRVEQCVFFAEFVRLYRGLKTGFAKIFFQPQYTELSIGC